MKNRIREQNEVKEGKNKYTKTHNHTNNNGEKSIYGERERKNQLRGVCRLTIGSRGRITRDEGRQKKRHMYERVI